MKSLSTLLIAALVGVVPASAQTRTTTTTTFDAGQTSAHGTETTTITPTYSGQRVTTTTPRGTTTTTEYTTALPSFSGAGSAGGSPPPDPLFLLSPQEKNRLAREAEERERVWTARCKPTIYTDAEGIRRYRYAASNCDMQAVSK